MGRLAEVEGEGEIWRGLRMKLFIQPERSEAAIQRRRPCVAEAVNE